MTVSSRWTYGTAKIFSTMSTYMNAIQTVTSIPPSNWTMSRGAAAASILVMSTAVKPGRFKDTRWDSRKLETKSEENKGATLKDLRLRGFYSDNHQIEVWWVGISDSVSRRVIKSGCALHPVLIYRIPKVVVEIFPERTYTGEEARLAFMCNDGWSISMGRTGFREAEDIWAISQVTAVNWSESCAAKLWRYIDRRRGSLGLTDVCP